MGLQWNGDGAWKEKTRKRRAEMRKRGLRIAPGKVRRRELCCLPPARIVVLFCFVFISICFL